MQGRWSARWRRRGGCQRRRRRPARPAALVAQGSATIFVGSLLPRRLRGCGVAVNQHQETLEITNVERLRGRPLALREGATIGWPEIPAPSAIVPGPMAAEAYAFAKREQPAPERWRACAGFLIHRWCGPLVSRSAYFRMSGRSRVWPHLPGAGSAWPAGEDPSTPLRAGSFDSSQGRRQRSAPNARSAKT
jgi:hypothetical protein